ncbi:SLC13 family permease [Paenibacillus chartarius]|uniref:SLC13 family permease n=1 Tax=Paenibacillus chartarius TaxID=747481 RepID=A0ABV6DIT7_9BACL
MYEISAQAAAWQTAGAAVVFAAIVFLFIWERWHRGLVAILGAAAVILIGAVPLSSLAKWLHLPFIALVIGMSAIAGVAQKSGLMAVLAVLLTRAGGGGPGRTVGLLLLATGAAGALLDPVAAVLTLIPVGLQLGSLLGLRRSPLLFGQMLAASLGGIVTLNGSPVNMLISAAHSFTYIDILLHIGLPALALLVAFTAIMAIIYRGRARPELLLDAAEWKPRAWLREPVLLRGSAVALGGVTLVFLLHHWLPVHPGWVALIAAAALVAFSRKRYDVRELVEDVDWRTASSLLGLFVLAGALAETGVIHALAQGAAELSAGSLPLLAVLLLWLSALLAGALGPLPVAALLVQLIPALAGVVPAAAADAAQLHPLYWALALGTALGAAASPLGAPGNVAAIAMAARAKESATVADFLRWSAPAAAGGLALATLYTLLQ